MNRRVRESDSAKTTTGIDTWTVVREIHGLDLAGYHVAEKIKNRYMEYTERRFSSMKDSGITKRVRMRMTQNMRSFRKVNMNWDEQIMSNTCQIRSQNQILEIRKSIAVTLISPL
jgi:hypothetical protein